MVLSSSCNFDNLVCRSAFLISAVFLFLVMRDRRLDEILVFISVYYVSSKLRVLFFRLFFLLVYRWLIG